MILTNEEKVARCLDVMLAEIKPANGFLTSSGVHVERLHARRSNVAADGREVAKARAAAGVKVSIRDASIERDAVASQHGRKRWNKLIELHCLHVLQQDEQEAGLLIDDAMRRFRDDVTWLLEKDEDLAWAWSKVCALDPRLAGQDKPSSVVLKVLSSDRLSPLETDGVQIIYLEHAYDAYAPEGISLPPV